MAAMKVAVALPITVKCRLGVDDQDIEESLDRFADTVMAAGAGALIVHARKAWLDGFSPRENRDIPPLDHARVHRLKRRLADFPIIINGGIHMIEEAEEHLRHVDGVMLGRAAYQNPGMLLALDPTLFGAAAPVSSAREAVEKLIPYIERAMAGGAACTTSRGIFSASSAASRARAPSAGISRPKPFSKAPRRTCCAKRSPWCWTATSNWLKPPPPDFFAVFPEIAMLAGVPVGEIVFLAAAILVAGIVTGLLAGLLGVGGAAITVPVLYEFFRFLGVPDEVRMQLCVGTSLAVIVPISLLVFAHCKAKSMDKRPPHRSAHLGRSGGARRDHRRGHRLLRARRAPCSMDVSSSSATSMGRALPRQRTLGGSSTAFCPVT